MTAARLKIHSCLGSSGAKAQESTPVAVDQLKSAESSAPETSGADGVEHRLFKPAGHEVRVLSQAPFTEVVE